MLIKQRPVVCLHHFRETKQTEHHVYHRDHGLCGSAPHELYDWVPLIITLWVAATWIVVLSLYEQYSPDKECRASLLPSCRVYTCELHLGTKQGFGLTGTFRAQAPLRGVEVF